MYKYKVGQVVDCIRKLGAISACYNGTEVKTSGIIMSRYVSKVWDEKMYILLCNVTPYSNAFAESVFEHEIDKGMKKEMVPNG